jgi:PASTA domain
VTVVDTTERPPYVGPRPYSADDRDLFFGREAETAELVSLVIAHRLVLLYSVSGAGKSSLLRAGLIVALETKGFEVLGPLRFQGAVRPPADAPNAYAYAVLSHIPHVDPASELGDALAGLPRGTDAYGFPSPRVLIVDQFEEIFTLHQDRWEHREGFIREMVEALARDPELRIVIALREEYIAQLDRYAGFFPDGARARFHLERLRAPAALEAVTCPVARRGVEFDPGVAEALVHDLRETRIDAGGGTTLKVLGEFVEPVQLQVVCRTMWSRLDPAVKRVTAADLAALGNVDDSLIAYYDEAVREALGRRRRLRREYKLREELERRLITSAGTRATIFAGAKETENLPAKALDTLADHHLLRTEWRAGGRWLELAHDRLIAPMRRSNRRVRSRYRRRRFASGFLGLLLGFAALVVLAALSYVPSEVKVPNVVGASSVFEAENVIVKAGLVLDGHVHQKRDSHVRPGSVIAQTPAAGERVEPGNSVALQIATGKAKVRVPSVVGQKLSHAERALRRTGLSLGQVSPSPVKSDDTIASQIPARGEVVVTGTPVDLFVTRAATSRGRR